MRSIARALAALLCAVAPAVVTPAVVGAAPLPILQSCQVRTDAVDSLSYRFCSGYMPSFDGLPLDADLTLPDGVTPPGGYPLVVMLHGWGNSKTDWESTVVCDPQVADSCGYNNVAFVEHGYAVLNYTARGFHGSCGPGSPNATTPACATGWTHLSDMRWEIRDTQFLAGVLVDAGVARPGIAVTGGSYGGGQSWLLALLADRVMNPDGTLSAWTSPGGVAMHIAVAVPKYPWTDLVDALQPNGRASDGFGVRDGNRRFPYGVDKESYVDYLNTSGAESARYAAPGQDPTADLTTWFAEINAGETPAESTYMPGIFNQLANYRSAYYQASLISADVAAGAEVPVFDVQGWTDDLFPGLQGAAMVKKLRAADAGWPAYFYASDVGHPPANNNKLTEWTEINGQIASFIDLRLGGAGSNPPAIYQEQLTRCDASAGAVYRASSPWGSTPVTASFASSAPGHVTASSPTDSAAGLATDPIAFAARNGGQGGCITLPDALPANGAMTSWTFPICATLTMLGQPVLHMNASIAGTDAEIDSRLWDVAGDGSVTLVSRGVYRWTGSPGAASIDYVMFGAGWVFAAGHSLRLEITQNDAPYLRLDNYASTVNYSLIRLALPVTHGPGC